jgi:hypothetical protein
MTDELTYDDEWLSPDVDFRDWAPILGRWERTEDAATYQGAPEPEPAVGILLAPDVFNLNAGTLVVTVRFPTDPEPEPQGRIVFGFHSRTQNHFSAGLGGWKAMYVVEDFRLSSGINPVRTLGQPASVVRDRDYGIAVHLVGQNVVLDVDGVEIMDVPLPSPPPGSQVGLIAWGRSDVHFSSFSVAQRAPRAFVVMQFGEPYDTLYKEVIQPVSAASGFDPYRADEVSGPGIILEDIISGIREAAVIVAEITPVNANVFYELGYAHATGKPTILLAEKGQQLPFDVSGFRVIFYDDSIGGKRRVESELNRHLAALR